MSRPEKNTVEYIPLDCQFSDSITALENIYGNDGFVVWVKLLQKLGRTENYIIDVRNNIKWSLFYSLFRLNEEKVIDILNFLANLECINPFLWNKRIIYSENLVKRISGVYRKRKYELKNINTILEEMGVMDVGNLIPDTENLISDVGNTQSKVKESKVKESKYSFIEKKEKKENQKKVDPYINKTNSIFIEEYQKVFNSKPCLMANQRNKLAELAAEVENFRDTIPVVLEKLKNINFSLPNFTPNYIWLLNDDNYIKVLSGTYDKKKTEWDIYCEEMRGKDPYGN